MRNGIRPQSLWFKFLEKPVWLKKLHRFVKHLKKSCIFQQGCFITGISAVYWEGEWRGQRGLSHGKSQSAAPTGAFVPHHPHCCLSPPSKSVESIIISQKKRWLFCNGKSLRSPSTAKELCICCAIIPSGKTHTDTVSFGVLSPTESRFNWNSSNNKIYNEQNLLVVKQNWRPKSRHMGKNSYTAKPALDVSTKLFLNAERDYELLLKWCFPLHYWSYWSSNFR